MNEAPTTCRRWFPLPPYSLRTLFVLVTVLALALALAIEHRERVRAEAVIDKIEFKIEGYYSPKTGLLVKREPQTTLAKISSILSWYREPQKVEEEFNLTNDAQ